VRRSEFDRAVTDEFGDRGSALITDLVLGQFGDRTPAEALNAGIPPREVWLALCVEMDVPLVRRYGAGRLEAKRR
jgi:hypothetical protein